jgi:hypothetical protein
MHSQFCTPLREDDLGCLAALRAVMTLTAALLQRHLWCRCCFLLLLTH